MGKQRVLERVDLSTTIGCLLMPKLRYLWRFDCGHEELRRHNTLSGNGSRGGRFYGICKQCRCCP